MDTVEKKSSASLVDCRATGEFIDRHYAKSNRFKLSQPIPMYNIDSTPNEASSITEVVNLILHYKNHSERTTFAVSGLGKQKLILGHSWLRKHNPEIDWITREVKTSRCPPDAAWNAEMKFVNSVLPRKQKVGQRTPSLLAPYLRLTMTPTPLTPPTKTTPMFLQNLWKRETAFWQPVYYLHFPPQTSEHPQPSLNNWLRLSRPTLKQSLL